MSVSPASSQSSSSPNSSPDRTKRKMGTSPIDRRAIEIVQTFSLGKSFPAKISKKLRERIAYFTRLFASVAAQWDKGEDLDKSHAVQDHFRGLSAITCSPEGILDELKLRAILSLDMAVSFPSHYPEVWKKAIGSFADLPSSHLQSIIHQLDSDTPLYQVSQRLFYKQIALFKVSGIKVRFFTIADLFYRWALQKGPERIGKATQNFDLKPYYVADQCACSSAVEEEHKSAPSSRSKTKSKGSFHSFLISETLLEYQRACGISLPPNFSKKLALMMGREDFRLEVTYYSAFPSRIADEQNVCLPEVLPYFDGLDELQRLANHCDWDPSCNERVFHWWLQRKRRKIDFPFFPGGGKKDISSEIEAISLLENRVLPQREFERYAFQILLALAPQPLARLSEKLTSFCQDIDWRYNFYSYETTMTVLLQRHFIWATASRGAAICKCLKTLGVTSTASQFPLVLISAITPQEVAEATQVIQKVARKKPKADECLTVLLRFPNNKEYARAFPDEYAMQSPSQARQFWCDDHAAVNSQTLQLRKKQVLQEAATLHKELWLSRAELFRLCCSLAEYQGLGKHLDNFFVLKKAIELVNAALPQGVAARLLRKGLDLTFFEDTVDAYIKIRDGMIRDLFQGTPIRFHQIKMQVIDLTLSAVGPASSKVDLDQQSLTALNRLLDHLNSSIVCRDVSAMTDVIKGGAKMGQEHVFVPFSDGIDLNRMICVGFRETQRGGRALDIALIHTPDFRTQVISLPLPHEPVDRDPAYYIFLGELADHHLQEMHSKPLPKTPEKFRPIEKGIQQWILELKLLFRQAVLELGASLNLDRVRNPNHFMIAPLRGAHFRYEGVSPRPLNSIDLPKNIAQKGAVGVNLHADSRTPFKAAFKKTQTADGVRWELASQSHQLNMTYPHFLCQSPALEAAAINWQAVWLKALVSDLVV